MSRKNFDPLAGVTKKPSKYVTVGKKKIHANDFFKVPEFSYTHHERRKPSTQKLRYVPSKLRNVN